MKSARIALVVVVETAVLAACVACLSVRAAHALDPSRVHQQYGHDAWRTEQGLPQDTVEAIAQTSDGYLWIGTQRGLARFDGVRFTLVTEGGAALPGSRAVDSLLAEPGGGLWITTDGGGLLHAHQGGITSLGVADGLPSDRLRALHRDPDGTLWIGMSQAGLVRLKGRSLAAFDGREGLASATVNALVRDRQGTLWAGTETGLGVFLDGGLVPVAAGGLLPDARVNALCEDRRGDLWIGTSGGLARRTGGGIQAVQLPGLAGEEILSLLEDRDGNLWVGMRRGLGRLREGRFESVTFRGDLEGESILTLFEDREGSLWIGTGSSGLHRLKDVAFTGITRAEGLPAGIVRAVYEDRLGNIWIGSDGGLSLLREGRISPFPGQDALRDVVRAIAEDREGNLWLGTYRGLQRLRDGRITVHAEEDGLSDSRIHALLEDRQGALWAGTYRGLNRIEGKTVTVYTRRDGLSDDRIFTLHEDRRGALWVGTKGGLSRIVRGRIETFAPGRGAPGRGVFAISEDPDGTLWIGAGSGLHRYRDGVFTPLHGPERLSPGGVLSLLDDGRGNLWLCEKGLVRLRKADLEADALDRPGRVPYRFFGTSDGMPSSECSGVGRPNALRTRDGRLWFATTRGVAVARTDHLPSDPLPPPVVIEGLVAGERPVSLPVSPRDEVRLPAGTDRFQIRYTALSLTNPSEVRFRYRMAGFDPAWIEAGLRRSADFTSLPPGAYTFRVEARDSDGEWSRTTSLPLRIEPRFHQTAWFLVLFLAAGASLAAAAVRLRTRALVRRERTLAALVEERTRAVQEEKARAEDARREAEEASRAKSEFLANVSHEIRTPMNAVIGMTSVLQGSALGRDQRDWVETIRRSSENLLGILNDILDLSKIEASRLELEIIRFSVADCVEEAVELLAESAARKRLELGSLVDESVPAAVLSDATRLRQVLVNFVGNAVKFTSGGEVFVSVGAAPEPGGDGVELRFSIRDTGPGIPADRMDRLFKPFSQADASTTRIYGGTGLGLAISQRLVERLGGRIEVESETGRGSTFRFTIRCQAAPAPAADDPSGRDGLAGRRLLIATATAPAVRVVEGYARRWGMHPRHPRHPGEEPVVDLGTDLAVVDQEEPSAAAWQEALEAAGVPIVHLRPLAFREMEEDWIPTAVARPLRRGSLLLAFRAALGLSVDAFAGSLGREDTSEIRAGLPSSLRILLAEDNSVNQKVALLLLDRLGYRADVAANGLEVLQALRRQPYDLVLMDVQMPEMDGLEATRRIAAEHPPEARPRIVAMTANALRSDREACLAAGMDDFLSKPVLLEDLRSALLRFGGRAAPEAAGPGEPPVLDSAALERLYQLEMLSGKPIVRGVVESFLSETPERLERMRQAIRRGDPREVAFLAHSLKGASAQLGAARLADASRELEELAANDDLAGAAKRVDLLERELKQAARALLAGTRSP